MSRYIDRDKLCDFARNHKDGTIDCNDIMRFPTTEIEEPTQRYIDANAAIKSFKDLHMGKEGGINCYTAKFIVEFLKTQPTTDVQEVKHGRWAHLGEDEWCCTCCGFVITTEGAWEEPAEKYCSYCGAKMGGEHEQTT